MKVINNKKAIVFFGIFIVIIISLLIYGCLKLLAPSTYEQYMKAGNICLEKDDYDGAIKNFKGALEKKENDKDALVLLSTSYDKNENYNEAVDTLLILQNADINNPYSYDQIISIGHKINEPEIANKQYINAYKRNIEINKALQPTAPSINLDNGSYNTIQSIKISTKYDSTIFYSITGEIPTRKSIEYKGRFYIDESGKYTILAVAYNNRGFISGFSKREISLTLITLNKDVLNRIGKTLGEIEKEVGSLSGPNRFSHRATAPSFSDSNGKLGYVVYYENFEDGELPTTTSKVPLNKECIGVRGEISEILNGFSSIKYEKFISLIKEMGAKNIEIGEDYENTPDYFSRIEFEMYGYIWIFDNAHYNPDGLEVVNSNTIVGVCKV